MMVGRARRKWTAEEDAVLRAVVNAALAESRPLLWRELAKDIPGRSNKDCRRRWWNSLADGTAKGLWSQEEDVKLIRAVNELGTNWRVVAQHVGSRTPDQCSSHWTQVLDPEINHCDWTSTEDDQLILEVRAHGTNWTTISTFHLPRRTTLALKNRYSTLRLKNENKRKRRRTPPNLLPLAGQSPRDNVPASKTNSNQSSPSLANSPSPDYDGIMGEDSSESGSYEPSGSDLLDDEMDGMTTGASTMGSVTSADLDTAIDWSTLIDSNCGLSGQPNFTDLSTLPQIWQKEIELPNYEQFLSSEPRISMADGDPFSLLGDPWALCTEPLEANYGFESSDVVSPTSTRSPSTHDSAKLQHQSATDLNPLDSTIESCSFLEPYQLSLDMTCNKAQLGSLMSVFAGPDASFTITGQAQEQ